MSKRKAWDQAIQQVAAQTGSKITVPGKLESEKRETRRRVNARRWIATSDVDDLRRKTEARLEALEEADHLGESTEVDDDEWLDDEEVRAQELKWAAIEAEEHRRQARKAKRAVVLEECGDNEGGGVSKDEGQVVAVEEQWQQAEEFQDCFTELQWWLVEEGLLEEMEYG